MNQPKDTLHVTVDFHGGQEEGDVGYPYYVASCDQIGAVTDGCTWGGLLRNLREVIELAFEDNDTVTVYNVVPNPRVIISMQLPENYAEMGLR